MKFLEQCCNSMWTLSLAEEGCIKGKMHLNMGALERVHDIIRESRGVF